MNPFNPSSGMYSIAKIGAATFCGAALGAMQLDTVPATWVDWKRMLAPALGAGIVAEFWYLRRLMGGVKP